MQITPCGGRKVKIPVLSLTVHFPGYLVTSIEKKNNKIVYTILCLGIRQFRNCVLNKLQKNDPELSPGNRTHKEEQSCAPTHFLNHHNIAIILGKRR